MKNPLLWLVVACIVIGLLAALCAFQGCQKLNYKKAASDYQLRLNACLNAPKTVDTVHDSILVTQTKWISLKGKIVYIHDTVTKYCRAFFDSTYHFTNTQGSGRIHYQIETNDCKASILFKDIVSPKEIITITEHRDTCIAKRLEYFPKNHLGLDINLYGRNFSEFPGGGADIWFTYKDKWGIKAGGLYLPQVKTGFVEIGGKIFIK